MLLDRLAIHAIRVSKVCSKDTSFWY